MDNDKGQRQVDVREGTFEAVRYFVSRTRFSYRLEAILKKYIMFGENSLSEAQLIALAEVRDEESKRLAVARERRLAAREHEKSVERCKEVVGYIDDVWCTDTPIFKQQLDRFETVDEMNARREKRLNDVVVNGCFGPMLPTPSPDVTKQNKKDIPATEEDDDGYVLCE